MYSHSCSKILKMNLKGSQHYWSAHVTTIYIISGSRSAADMAMINCFLGNTFLTVSKLSLANEKLDILHKAVCFVKYKQNIIIV